MKIKEIKHNHSLTDLLKVLLFSIIMLAPILAIGVKCGYVILNKNAKDSYSGVAMATNNYVDTLVEDGKYEFNKVENEVINFSADFKCEIQTFRSSLTSLENYVLAHLNDINRVVFTNTESNITQIRFYNNDTYLDYWTIQTNSSCFFTFLSTETTTIGANTYIKSYTITNSTLDNVFYYAINEVAQEPLFNWTQNTAIYTGVNAMCTGMEITSPIIPILITYWFLLTCIYVIIDILIKGFTMLTHLIGSKLA